MQNNHVFVKDLSGKEQEEILSFILDKFSTNNKEKFKNFCNVIIEYIKTVRRNISTFCSNVDEIIDLFTKCNYDEEQIISLLTKEPSLLHSDKNDLFWRILILGKVNDTKNGGTVREFYLVQNPRILRISQDLMYARIKYLESDEGKQYLRKDQGLTARQITKITNEEFKKSYGIDKASLMRNYPFDHNAQLDVISWEENKQLLNNIFENGRTR